MERGSEKSRDDQISAGEGRSEAASGEDENGGPICRGNLRAVLLRSGDSVAVAIDELPPRATCSLIGERGGEGPAALETIPRGHKIALRDIASGEAILKYGRPIGRATARVAAGAWVHSHNLASGLSAGLAGLSPSARTAYIWAERERLAFTLESTESGLPSGFEAYHRGDGSVGIRNELWILPTVGCVNGSAEIVARIARESFGIDAFALTHPLGCSQLGGDLEATRAILTRLAVHPNAGAVLVLSLGCESNRLAEFKQALGPYDRERTRFIGLQDEADELAAARRILGTFASILAADRRIRLPLSALRIGLKCGGSDGFSGITANPLVGKVCDLVIAAGGGAFMSEVPEMFGAEEDLYERAADLGTLTGMERMIEGFKDYYAEHGQPVYENPSPGNKDGGITTLEEKSLGCVRKAGGAPISGILPYGGASRDGGLRLVSGPGNDLISSTALAAAGAQLVLFTTGRGTPFGAPVPTLKISSNGELAARKPGWIDFDAGRALSGDTFDDLALELLRAIVDVAEGKPTKAEVAGHRGIAIFKEGVTL